MQYYGLKSIVASLKKSLPLQVPSESFYTTTTRVTPYIEPTFSKEEYPTKRPAILLVSAVGASGKSVTARALAYDTGLPVLDLAKHKPVGDNTLTGILTTAYPIEKVGEVLEGLRRGTYGIIIDGIDEGRSKTTEQGFEAFLDDLIERSKGAEATSIVVFGRSQVLLNTWCYLDEKGIDVGLVKINPFNLEQAKGYIDAYVPQRNPAQQNMYEMARDGVLEKLGAAFASSTDADNAFLSFIGYPPVLDAIATLLREEPNYHRISRALSDAADGHLEVELLIRIADFLLDRDRSEKAVPHFIDPIVKQADGPLARDLRQSLYNREEQCARILARGLGQGFRRQCVPDNALNEQYETALDSWFPDHPFLDDRQVRNAVFEAVAVARCALSDVPEYQTLACEYAASKRPTYHLLYIMSKLAEGKKIESRFFNMLIQSCSEFVGSRGDININIEVNGVSWEESDIERQTSADLELTITLPDWDQERVLLLLFRGSVFQDDEVTLGPYLVNTSVILPCHVKLQGMPGVECIGACHITARTVRIDTSDLVVRGAITTKKTPPEAGLFVNVRQAVGHANAVSVKGGIIEIGCCEHSLDYPLAKYVQRRANTLSDPDLEEKFFRFRRIMLEFRSHKMGGLAKYREKIEHNRVLRNEVGQRVLDQLVKEDILRVDAKFYYVQPEQCSKKLGVTWQDLRHHHMSKELKAFLERIKI